MLTDTGNPKAWPRVFADRAWLLDACVSVYEHIEPVGSGGGNLRALYAGFLEEAAGLLDAPALGQAAAAYRAAGARWHELAEAALPADREPFAEARRLTGELQRQVERGDAGRPAAAETAGRLWGVRDRWRAEFPGGEHEIDALLAELAARVGAVHRAETAALAQLARALPS
jgi:hypothetical protein